MADNWMLKAVISANSDGMIKALKNINTMTKSTRKYLLDVGKSASTLSGKIGLPFAALSGVIGGFSLAGIKNAVVGFTEMGESIERGAIQAGMSVEEYQRMKYVAEQSSTSVEALGASLGKLNRNTGDAAAGKNKNLASLYQKLGVSMRDANGNVRRGVDLLPELADAFKRNENPAIRARMGMALFGKSWQEIAPLLVEGSAGITKNLERMSRLKGVFPAEDIRGAKALGDQFKDLNMVLKGFQMVIARELAPVIGPLIDDLTAWWVANKKLVSVEVAKMAREFGAWIKSIDFKAVLAGVQNFIHDLGSLVDKFGGVKNALIALVIFMNLGAVSAFLSLGGAVLRLGAYLGALALKALAPVAPLQTLTTGLKGAELQAAMTTNTIGRLGAAVGVLGAAWAGYQIGSLINDYIINPAVKKLTGDEDATLGGWLYDKTHPDNAGTVPAAAARGDAPRPLSPWAAPARGRVEGKVDINIAGLPQGSTVTQSSAGSLPMNLDAGYRSFATGAGGAW